MPLDIWDQALDQKVDKERERQIAEFARLGATPPPAANLDVWEVAAKAKPKSRGEEMYADIQKVRGKGEPSIAGTIIDKLGGASGIGATAGAVAGNFLAPETGGLSLLIPILLAGGGGATGAALEGKNPLTEGAKEGLLQAAFGGAAKALPGVKKIGEDALVKMFATRANAAEAGESLLRRLVLPVEKAADIYKRARAIKKPIEATETFTTMERIFKDEEPRAPTPIKDEIQDAFKRLRDHFKEPNPTMPYSTPTQPNPAMAPKAAPIKMGQNPWLKGNWSNIPASQNAPLTVKNAVNITPPPPPQGKEIKSGDLMEEVERFRELASGAFKAGKTKLGNLYNEARNAMLNDLEKSGIGEARQASKAYRKEMAFEKLANKISKSEPLTKIRDLERQDKLFKDAGFTDTEKEQIDRIVKKIATVAPTGASGVIGRGVSWLLGAALGTPGGYLGHLAGGAAGELGSEYLRTLLASPQGRKYIEKVLDAEIKFGTNRVAGNVGAATAMLARGLAQPPKDEE